MRKQQEIIQRLKDIESEDVFGIERSDLIPYLDYENAKEFLKEGITKEEWDKDRKSTDEEVMKEMSGYIEFAWDKAIGERGLSANRNIMHYSAWIWLLNDGSFEEYKEKCDNEYSEYGKPVLSWICKKYGYDNASQEQNDG